MLRLIISGEEFFDEAKEEFINVEDIVLDLEHSLVSLSKWESRFEKPFLEAGKKTTEETLEYIREMIITPNVPKDVLSRLTSQHFAQINVYIDSKQSATTFGSMPEKKGKGERITSELIYYWMVTFNIPFECENWHLNRLFALVRICNLKNSTGKKMSKSEILARNRQLNEQRKAQLGTRG
jgi:hypothetical protein